MTQELYLYAAVSGVPVAIPTSRVEAVVRLSEIVPVQCVPPYVRGLAALRSRVLTVIDMEMRVHGASKAASELSLAIVVNVGGHAYGLLVASVSDIATPSEGVKPLRGRLDDAWIPYVSGVALHRGRTHLVLSVEDFVAPGSDAILAA
jgi:purine-binding chemotaxis protein CheW